MSTTSLPMHPVYLDDCGFQHSFSAGAPASVPLLRSTASILKGKAAEIARNAQRISQQQGLKPSQQAAPLSPNARFRQGMSLAGKGFSKLPEGQRQLLEKKAKVGLLCLPFPAMMRSSANALLVCRVLLPFHLQQS